MAQMPKPPKRYKEFVARYPKLGEAWEKIAEAGESGPLDARTIRLLKLAISIDALKEGAVNSSVRKALALGISRDEIEQVIALAAGTLGLPSTVAVFSWVQDQIEKQGSAKPR